VQPPDGTPPFPPDAAALHHVLPGGWIWVLRFNNGTTSAGAALTDPLAHKVRASDGGTAWRMLLERLPTVAAQFRPSRAVRPFTQGGRLAFRSEVLCGARWAMLPSAAGVIDPLLSTGFPLTLLGIGRLLAILENTSAGAEREAALRAYSATTQTELDVTERLVGALYRSMGAPEVFKRLSLLYFAAASFSEAARRLGRPDLAPGFLLHAHPRFGGELRACATLASACPDGADRAELFSRIDRAIEPFDVAGLGDRTRGDWYPVRAEDLVAGAERLGASAGDVERLLERSGFRVPV
jgi:FADH2 O2-dependent halogenase